MAAALGHKEPSRHRPRHDRRRYPRGVPHGCERARLRPGGGVRLLDVSAGGALVEGETRMTPGSSVELRLAATAVTTSSVRARVTRCHVSALIGAESVRYAAALEFQHLVEWLPQLVTRNGGELEGGEECRDG